MQTARRVLQKPFAKTTPAIHPKTAKKFIKYFIYYNTVGIKKQ